MALPKAGCVRQEPAAGVQDAGCAVCVCPPEYLPIALYPVLYRSVPLGEVIGQTGRAGVHAAQPLWLVMMINVGKWHPEWCVTGRGLPLSTVQRLGGRLHAHADKTRR